MSARSRTPRIRFSARAGDHDAVRPRRLDGRGDALGGQRRWRGSAGRVREVLHRRAGRAGLRRRGDRRGHAGGIVGEAVLEVGVDRQRRRRGELGRVGDRLVAASRRRRRARASPRTPSSSWRCAWKPSEANSFADPASHAFGITSGVPGTCRARKAARTSWVLIAPSCPAVPRRAGFRRGLGADLTSEGIAVGGPRRLACSYVHKRRPVLWNDHQRR